MATYVYRCPDHGEFEAEFPMGRAPAEIGCSQWGIPTRLIPCPFIAKRVYTPPAITYGPGMKPPWADKIQRGSEEAKRFR